ncbi:lanosterol 14-alpha demethylase-like [Watersipora subatra]|uniref:lanosterol 14-alpha demethylase-like n=1 Tax=Watersipora subatra TaxID=2589382 RepID=UPI00355B1145
MAGTSSSAYIQQTFATISEGINSKSGDLFAGCNLTTITTLILIVIAVLLLRKATQQNVKQTGQNAPPIIPSYLPFLGCAIEFNKNPVDFLLRMRKKYGPVFTFQMAGKNFTYLVGHEASSLLFNSKNEDLNAEDVYGKLVTPVFGKGVAYDVPHHVFLEQKKMFKGGLNVANFKEHVSVIEKEVREYLTRWGESGQVDLFTALSEMIIMTASHCLHGSEIRSVLDEKVANLYNVLDQGFCPEAWLLPSSLHWIVPKLRRRDAAHLELKEIFYKAIAKRRSSGVKGCSDMLQTLLDTPYKDGRYMTDDEIAGMLIGLLMAGQHTSSSTSSWLGLFLAHNPDLQEQCYQEQLQVRGSAFDSLDYEQLKDMKLLECNFKEALRLRPPIYVIMRQSRKPMNVCGYTIPTNHSVCVSPTTNQRLADVWGEDNCAFNPERFLDGGGKLANESKFCYVPFGAGRHRCIGETFAYIQNKTIWSVLLETYQLTAVGDFPEPNYQGMIHTPVSSIVGYKRRQV